MPHTRVFRCLLPILLACASGTAVESGGPADLLAWTEGKWHGARRDTNDGSEAPMTIVIERIPNGRGTIERLEVATDGDPYVGFSVSTPNPEGGGWTRLYANDVHQKFARLVAESVAGDRTVWQSVTATPPRGSRLISERMGPDRWRRTQQVSNDNGATWQVLFVDELERYRPE